MDGRGRYLDNIFVEQLWRSVKHEDVYLKEYATVPALTAGWTTTFTCTTMNGRIKQSRPTGCLIYLRHFWRRY
jgi:hypothetical protein